MTALGSGEPIPFEQSCRNKLPQSLIVSVWWWVVMPVPVTVRVRAAQPALTGGKTGTHRSTEPVAGYATEHLWQAIIVKTDSI